MNFAHRGSTNWRSTVVVRSTNLKPWKEDAPMTSPRRNSMVRWFLVVFGSILSSFNATAQVAPVGPVKLIVPSAAGGAVDVIARIVADHLRRSWNQQVLVVNHPGAGGAIGVRAAGTSPSDGSTLYLAISSNFVPCPSCKPPCRSTLRATLSRLVSSESHPWSSGRALHFGSIRWRTCSRWGDGGRTNSTLQS